MANVFNSTSIRTGTATGVWTPIRIKLIVEICLNREDSTRKRLSRAKSIVFINLVFDGINVHKGGGDMQLHVIKSTRL